MELFLILLFLIGASVLVFEIRNYILDERDERNGRWR